MGSMCCKGKSSGPISAELAALQLEVAKYRAENLIPEVEKHSTFPSTIDCSVATEQDAQHVDVSVRDLYALASKLVSIKSGHLETLPHADTSQKDLTEIYERAMEAVCELIDEREATESQIRHELERIDSLLHVRFPSLPRTPIQAVDFAGLSAAVTHLHDTYDHAYKALKRDFDRMRKTAKERKAALEQLHMFLAATARGEVSEHCSSPDMNKVQTMVRALKLADSERHHWQSQCSTLQAKVAQLSEDIDIKRLLLLHVKEESERLIAENHRLQSENNKFKVLRSHDEMAQQIDDYERQIQTLKDTITSLQEDLRTKDKEIEHNERKIKYLEDTMKEAEEQTPNDFNRRMSNLQSQLQEYYSAYDSPDSSSED